MIGRDHSNVPFQSLLREAASNDHVGLEMHDIRFHVIQNSGAVGLDAPRKRETQPRMRLPAPTRKTVHGDEFSAVFLFECPLPSLPRGGRHDVHTVPASGKTARQGRRERCRTVNFWSESVRAYDDGERLQRIN
jgi:hypothetical protein